MRVRVRYIRGWKNRPYKWYWKYNSPTLFMLDLGPWELCIHKDRNLPPRPRTDMHPSNR